MLAELWWIWLGGFFAGLLGALVGLGGGIVAVPFVNLVVGASMHCAAAAGLISTLTVSCGAAGRYLRKGGLVPVDLALKVELVTAVGALGGGMAVGYLKGPVLQVLFAVLLLASALRLALGRESAGEASPPDTPALPRRIWTVYAMCLTAGFLGGILGVGGGFLIVPALHLVLAMPFKSAAATSNFVMGMTAVPALLGFAHRGQVDLRVGVPLAMGVLVGANLGAFLMPRIQTRALKWTFALLLLVAAGQMIYRGARSW